MRSPLGAGPIDLRCCIAARSTTCSLPNRKSFRHHSRWLANDASDRQRSLGLTAASEYPCVTLMRAIAPDKPD